MPQPVCRFLRSHITSELASSTNTITVARSLAVSTDSGSTQSVALATRAPAIWPNSKKHVVMANTQLAGSPRLLMSSAHSAHIMISTKRYFWQTESCC